MKLINKLLGAAKAQDAQKKLSSGATDVGRERAANEDYYRIIPEKNLYIVADGMGGHNAGDVASLNATKKVDAYFTLKRLEEIHRDEKKVKRAMVQSLLNAHGEILKMASENSAYEGMGCTIVVAIINENNLHLGHVGDARAYVGTGSKLELLTTDHSYVMEMVKRGKLTIEEARVSPFKNRLNQAIGAAAVEIKPDYRCYSLKEDDRILLCSDGLWDMLSDEQMYHILMQEKPAKEICKQLVDMANQAGGHDNITALVIIFRKDVPGEPNAESGEFLDTSGEYSYIFEE